jgi:hypothetical protein
MAVDTQAFATSLGINVAIGIAFFVVFSFLRSAAFTKKFYSPKRFVQVQLSSRYTAGSTSTHCRALVLMAVSTANCRLQHLRPYGTANSPRLMPPVMPTG